MIQADLNLPQSFRAMIILTLLLDDFFTLSSTITQTVEETHLHCWHLWTPLQAMSYMKLTFILYANHYPLKSLMSNSKNLQLLPIGLTLSNMILQPTINGGTRTTLIRDYQNSRISILLTNLLETLTRRSVILPSLTDLVKSRRRIGLSNTRMAKERRRLKYMKSLLLMQLLGKKTPLIPLNISQIILKM